MDRIFIPELKKKGLSVADDKKHYDMRLKNYLPTMSFPKDGFLRMGYDWYKAMNPKPEFATDGQNFAVDTDGFIKSIINLSS